MGLRVGINGFGRIGRNVVRAAVRMKQTSLEFVAVNDITDTRTLAHLLKYDSVLGRLDYDIQVADDGIKVDGDTLKVLAVRDPKELPWGELGVDVVIESTGIFTSREKAAWHLEGGAPFVIVSAPCSGADATFVVGVNDGDFDAATHKVVSNASCTTNCFVPMIKVLDDAFGVEKGLMTTVHAYTNDQNLLDLRAVGEHRCQVGPDLGVDLDLWTYEPLQHFLHALDQLVERDGVLRDIGSAVIPCNWLQIMENSLDPVHVEWLHGYYMDYVWGRKGVQNPPRFASRHKKIGFTHEPAAFSLPPPKPKP